jgi:hypothetical protein
MLSSLLPVIRGRIEEGESRKGDLSAEKIMIWNWLTPIVWPSPSLPSPV